MQALFYEIEKVWWIIEIRHFEEKWKDAFFKSNANFQTCSIICITERISADLPQMDFEVNRTWDGPA